MVIIVVQIVGWRWWLSGIKSLAPRYKNNPVKTAIISPKTASETLIKIVDIIPSAGAKETIVR